MAEAKKLQFQVVDQVTGLAVSPVLADKTEAKRYQQSAPHATEVRQVGGDEGE